MEQDEQFLDKKELSIHRFKILDLEKVDSLPFLLERYYNKAIKQTLLIILILLLIILIMFII